MNKTNFKIITCNEFGNPKNRLPTRSFLRMPFKKNLSNTIPFKPNVQMERPGFMSHPMPHFDEDIHTRIRFKRLMEERQQVMFEIVEALYKGYSRWGGIAIKIK